MKTKNISIKELEALAQTLKRKYPNAKEGFDIGIIFLVNAAKEKAGFYK